MNLELAFNQNNLLAFLQVSLTPTSITKISFNIPKNKNNNQMKDDKSNSFFCPTYKKLNVSYLKLVAFNLYHTNTTLLEFESTCL